MSLGDNVEAEYETDAEEEWTESETARKRADSQTDKQVQPKTIEEVSKERAWLRRIYAGLLQDYDLTAQLQNTLETLQSVHIERQSGKHHSKRQRRTLPLPIANFSAAFSSTECHAQLHEQLEVAAKRLQSACIHCTQLDNSKQLSPKLCIKICRLTKLRVSCRKTRRGRRKRPQQLALSGSVTAMEWPLLSKQCNTACITQWRLLGALAAVPLLRDQLHNWRSPPPPPITGSVRVKLALSCPSGYQLQLPACERTASSSRAVQFVSLLVVAVLAAFVVGAWLTIKYWRPSMLKDIAIGWRKLLGKFKSGQKDAVSHLTQVQPHRRSSMVPAAGVTDKHDRDQIREMAEKWSRRRHSEKRSDGAPPLEKSVSARRPSFHDAVEEAWKRQSGSSRSQKTAQLPPKSPSRTATVAAHLPIDGSTAAPFPEQSGELLPLLTRSSETLPGRNSRTAFR